MAHLPQTRSFSDKSLLQLPYTISRIHCTKFRAAIFWPKKECGSFVGGPIVGPKWSICPKQGLFGKNQYYFHLPIDPFHWAKSKKKITMDPELWGWVIFGPKMDSFAQTNFFQKAC